MRSWRTLLVLVLVVMLVLSAVDAKRKKKPKPKPMLDPFVPDSPERAQCKLLCRNNFNVQADMCRLYGEVVAAEPGVLRQRRLHPPRLLQPLYAVADLEPQRGAAGSERLGALSLATPALSLSRPRAWPANP
mgnify:CR=1 FL=1